MTRALSNLKVLDLSWGFAVPMFWMLIAGYGAEVTYTGEPQGDPFARQLGPTVWHRGKRNVVFGLKNTKGKWSFLRLDANAEDLTESFTPALAKCLGIDFETLSSNDDAAMPLNRSIAVDRGSLRYDSERSGTRQDQLSRHHLSPSNRPIDADSMFATRSLDEEISILQEIGVLAKKSPTTGHRSGSSITRPTSSANRQRSVVIRMSASSNS